MKSWIIQPPEILRRLFYKSLWRLPKGEKQIALTFDDGPVPEQTEWVLATLDKYGVKATFFCVGDNIRKHPALFAQIVERGHAVGNHTFNHLQLFKTGWSRYRANIDLSSAIDGNAQLFRPPHGQMTPCRAWQLRKRFRRMVFWDVMPKDYDRRLTPQQVFDNVKRYTRDGSIIVFHDSIKAGDRMRFALEQTIVHFKNAGWKFVGVE